MDIYVMDASLKRVGVIDGYRSLIWTSRYYESGDFELYLDATQENIDLCQKNRFLYRAGDYMNGVFKSVMIIRYVQLNTSIDDGNTLLVKGPDIKSIIGRRIIWSQTILSGTLETNIRNVINANIINPSISERKISNFILGPEMGGTSQVDVQATGDSIDRWLTEQITPFEIGYDVQIQEGKFVFFLYKGADRSYDQTENPYVIFSPDFENLLTSDYVESEEDTKNFALVAGEGEGSARRITTVGNASLSGLNRIELFVDARDVSSTTDGGTLTPAQYNAQLRSRGLEKLAEFQDVKIFEGEVEAQTNFIYGEDYFLGDKVQVVNEYGIGASARIVEIIDAEDEIGRTVIPTFSTGG